MSGSGANLIVDEDTFNHMSKRFDTNKGLLFKLSQSEVTNSVTQKKKIPGVEIEPLTLEYMKGIRPQLNYRSVTFLKAETTLNFDARFAVGIGLVVQYRYLVTKSALWFCAYFRGYFFCHERFVMWAFGSKFR